MAPGELFFPVRCNLEAERGVLGSVLIKPEILRKVREILVGGPDDFYRDIHQFIYSALLAIDDRGDKIDCITLSGELEHRNLLKRVGGDEFIGELANGVPHAINAPEYAAFVREHAVKRELIAATEEIARTVNANGRTAAQLVSLATEHVNRISTLLRGVDEPDIQAWPEPPPEVAWHGLAGDVTRLITPHTEADPLAILVQFLAGFGAIIGRGPHWQVESTRHNGNLYACIVGSSSKARKGTSWDNVRWILSRADEEWAKNQVMCGLSTGEGLIWTVRDPITKREKVGDHHEDREIDPGVADKRVLWVESEFESVLSCMSRDANTLNAVMRQAWDGHLLRVATKNSPNRATGAHVSIVAHITVEALVAKLTRTDLANGFANRFLWVCARRSKLLPHGGRMSREASFPALLDRVKDAVLFARNEFHDDVPVCRTEEANRYWETIYPKLTSPKPGLIGAVTSRAEAQVMRLALLFAVLDLEKWIGPVHLQAAEALWDYCDRSATYIFGSSLGDPRAEKLLEALKDAGDVGLSLSEIRQKVFGGRVSAEDYSALLVTLSRSGLAHPIPSPKGGKQKTWVAS